MAAIGFKAVSGAGCAQHIVTYPNLKQVTEYDQSIGWAAAQVRPPGGYRGGIAGLQVQVRDEINAGPALGRDELWGRHAKGQSATARSITTSSTGTSSWYPLRLVLTAAILSTTSVPPTTLPNTA